MKSPIVVRVRLPDVYMYCHCQELISVPYDKFKPSHDHITYAHAEVVCPECGVKITAILGKRGITCQ